MLRADIGSAFPLEEEQVQEVRGSDIVSGLPRRSAISSEEVRAALEEPLEQIVAAVKATLDECTPDLAADLVDTGMVLTGGGALLRGIDQLLGERTGLPVRVAPNALTAVASGALICLEHFSTWRAALESSDDEV